MLISKATIKCGDNTLAYYDQAKQVIVNAATGKPIDPKAHSTAKVTIKGKNPTGLKSPAKDKTKTIHGKSGHGFYNQDNVVGEVNASTITIDIIATAVADKQ